MKRVYVSSNRTDAYLVRDRLLHAGIAVHVFNEHAQSIVGDVPPDVAWPQVWVDDDADAPRAEQVIGEFRRDGFGEARVIGQLAAGPATVTVD